jgi:phosphopantetheinyl transferase
MPRIRGRCPIPCVGYKADDIDIWIATFERSWSSRHLVSDEDLRASEVFRFQQHQEQFLARRCFQRAVLAGYLSCSPDLVHISRSCTFCGHPTHGQPRLPDMPELRFSTSSTDGLFAIAVSFAGHIGLDVARPAEVERLDPSTYLTADEGSRVSSQPTPIANSDLCAAWCIKEAYGKAVGLGLALSPTCIDTRRRPHIVALEHDFPSLMARSWIVGSAADAVLAVVAGASAGQPTAASPRHEHLAE